jgi:hypothetical protein
MVPNLFFLTKTKGYTFAKEGKGFGLSELLAKCS